MNKPLISVCIPLYNAEQYIERCVKSIINQSFSDIEVIIVDDCSTDNSYNIVKRMSEADSRVKVYRHAVNEKSLMARKTATLVANGKYLMYIDSDDQLAEGSLQKLYELITAVDVDIIEFNASVIDNLDPDKKIDQKYCQITAGYLYGKDIFKAMVDNKIGQMVWNKLYKTELCRQAYSLSKINVLYSRDDIYFCSLLYSMAESYYGIDEPYYIYTLYSGQSRKKKITLEFFDETCKSADIIYALIETYYCTGQFDEVHKELIKSKVNRWVSQVNGKTLLTFGDDMFYDALNVMTKRWLCVDKLIVFAKNDDLLQEFAVFIVQTFSSFLDGAFAVHHGIIKNRYIKEAFTKLSEVECFKKVLTRLGIYIAFLRINIDIFGSCVCRDVFNHPNDKFNVVHYINGCSPFSITSPKYENICVKPDDLSLKSNFERRSTCIDVNKSYMEFFEVGTNNSDYLIIDLSDSRLSLGQTMLNNSTQNYILSYGTTFMENYKKDFLNGKFKNISLQKVNALRISDGEWKEAIRRYCDYIASMNYKKVIVVESYCALSYYDAENGIRTDFDNIDYLMELNSLFKKLYAYLREYMPQAVFVGFSGEFVGLKQHKLGLYPLHFTNEIYEHIGKDIEKAITC